MEGGEWVLCIDDLKEYEGKDGFPLLAINCAIIVSTNGKEVVFMNFVPDLLMNIEKRRQ